MVNEIKKAISINLNNIFGSNYEIYTEKINQKLNTPAFFIYLINSNVIQAPCQAWEKENYFDIHYFPKNDYNYDEMEDVASLIWNNFEYITLIDGTILHCINFNYEITDGILHFFFQVNLRFNKIISKDLMITFEKEEIIND